MSIYIWFPLLLVLIPVVIGIGYLARKSQGDRPVPNRRPDPPPRPGEKNIDPVTLDRSPQMPHKPGATS
jgi:hypothetical protein